uniref:nostrin isoform X2 n=1 Tax=Doryrhamphus excisus TaxID=161450 RepID=UPI0025AE4C67|nr:nostrin isoform X2 [Doryrhamphus excisus]
MKDYMSSCSVSICCQCYFHFVVLCDVMFVPTPRRLSAAFQYKQLYEDGECFCKELMSVLQQRAELEHTYAKGLQKLAGKLLRASKGMSSISIFSAWCHVSDEMYSRADAHRYDLQEATTRGGQDMLRLLCRSLGNAFRQEAILEIRQVLDEHNKRKRPLDTAIERTGKLVMANWNQQLKTKKKLLGLTREHEALFNFVENNKQICTEKEKQKMLNRLTKSAELQTRVDEEYFHTNMEGHQMRLKWENTLKNCYQILQELEKQRMEVLCNVVNRYNLHMSSFGQTLKHGQKQIELLVQRVDMDKDVQTLLEDNSITTADSKAEFLMTDYYEEDRKSLMAKERRIEAVQVKLHRLEDSISKTKKDCEGIEKLMKTYAENPSFSNQRNIEETEQQLDESRLKLDLLEATHYKLSSSLCELEGQPKPLHRFGDSIVKWKDKDCEHSVVQLTRPVKLRKTSFRTRHSLRASIIYKGPVQTTTSPPAEPSPSGQLSCTVLPQESENVVPSSTHKDEEHGQRVPDVCRVGQCKALYSFTPTHHDELPLQEGTRNMPNQDDSQIKTHTVFHRGSTGRLHEGRERLVVWSTSWPDGSFPIHVC